MPEDSSNPSPTPSEPPQDFVSFMDNALSGVKVSPDPLPSGEPGPAKPDDRTVTGDLVAPPADVTKKLAGVPDEPVDDFAKRESELDELFKSKSGQAFQELKGELKTTRKQLNEETSRLKAELDEARKGVQDPAEIARLKEEVKRHQETVQTYEQELAVTRVEATLAYKEHVAKPLAALNNTVAEIAKLGSVKTADVQAALDEADPAEQDRLLTEIASNLSERQRITLYSLVPQYQNLREQEKYVRENAQQALQVIQDRETKASAAEQQRSTEEYKEALDTTWQDLQKNVPFLRPIEGQPEWNKTLSDLDVSARAVDLNSLSAPERARVVYEHKALPVALHALQYYAKEAVRLQGLLTKYDGGSLPAGEGAGAHRDALAKRPVAEGGFLESVGVTP